MKPMSPLPQLLKTRLDGFCETIDENCQQDVSGELRAESAKLTRASRTVKQLAVEIVEDRISIPSDAVKKHMYCQTHALLERHWSYFSYSRIFVESDTWIRREGDCPVILGSVGCMIRELKSRLFHCARFHQRSCDDFHVLFV